MLTLAPAGDAVLLPTPWFWNHQQTLEMMGIEARALPCDADAGFVPDPGTPPKPCWTVAFGPSS